MRRHLLVSTFALVAVVGSFSASAGEGRRTVYAKPRAAQPAVVHTVAAQTQVTDNAAQPNVAELRARITELSKRVSALEAAAAEDRRQIANLANQLDRTVTQQITRPISVPVTQPSVDYSNDIFPNEYPYGG